MENKMKSKIFKFLNELNYEQLKESVNDLYWEYDRMSSSGQETLDKMADILKLPNFVERELVKKTENSIFIMFEQSGKKTPIDYMVAENGGISFFSNEKLVAWTKTPDGVAYLLRKRGLSPKGIKYSSSINFASEYGFKNNQDAIALFDEGLLKHEKENAKLKVFNPVI